MIQFNTFNVKENGNIDIEDFAKSVISYSSRTQAKHFLQALRDKPLPPGEVSLDEFKAFKEFIHDDLDSLQRVMKDSGVMTLKKFDRVVKQLSEDNTYKINDNQYMALFSILDANNDGKVSYEEFNNLLRNAQKLGRCVESSVGHSFISRRLATAWRLSKT